MITKNLVKFFTACIIFTVLSTSALAACIPALVVIKSVEKNGAPYDADGLPVNPNETSSGGRAHAIAYGNGLSNLLVDKGYCGLFKYMTVGPLPQPINADVISKDSHLAPLSWQILNTPGRVFVTDANGTNLSVQYDWSNPVFLQSIIQPGTPTASTLIVLDEKEIWGELKGDSGLPNDIAGLMKSIIDYDKSNDTYHNLRRIGYPMPYNQVYVFSQQDPLDYRFTKVEAYLQLYRFYSIDGYDGSKNRCSFRVPSGVTALLLSTLIKIDSGTSVPPADIETYYPALTLANSCDY